MNIETVLSIRVLDVAVERQTTAGLLSQVSVGIARLSVLR